MLFFYRLGIDLSRVMTNYLEGQSDPLSGDGQFVGKWGWYQSIYVLAQGDIRRLEDITQLNVHKCLTMLSFMKEKNDLESKKIKSKTR